LTCSHPSRDRLIVRALVFGSTLALLLAISAMEPRASLAAPTVAIIETQNTGIISSPTEAVDRPRARREIAGAVSAAAEAIGATIVPVAQLQAAGLAECSSSGCPKRIGAATGATFVLVVDAAFDLDTFKFHLDMWSASTGDHLDGEGRDCDGCSLNDFTRALRDRTTLLCERVFHSQAASSARAPGGTHDLNPKQPTAAAPPLIGPGASVGGTGPNGAPSAWPARLAIAGMVVGVAAIATGAVVLSRNNDLDCSAGDASPCAFRKNTKWGGGLLVAGGAIAAGASGIVLYRVLSPDRDVVTSIGPAGLSLQSRF
jgi:hypothetical protein